MTSNSWRMMVLLCTGATWTALAGEGARAPAADRFPWESRPTLEAIYAGFNPDYSIYNRSLLGGRKGGALESELKFSKQKLFPNLADVRMDSQVQPIVQKGLELEQKGRHREATGFYRRILLQHPDDLLPIAEEGIFIPASLYVQRRILAFPSKELSYYRLLYDPAAKDIYERAARRFSIPDFKDLVRSHLAASYGDDALFALGRAALDGANYDEARRYFEDLVTYHGLQDDDQDDLVLHRDQIWVRLAICYRHLGLESAYAAAVKRIENRKEPTVANLLAQLDAYKYDEFAVRQRENRRSARYDALDDKRLAEPLPYPLPDNRGEWRVSLDRRPGHFAHRYEPEALPWATETDLIYKDMNVLYSRSLLTGDLNWAFGPGGSTLDWDRYAPRGTTNYYPQQSILVHDGAVFAHLFAFGPSLTAVDQHSGRLLWAKGPMAVSGEDEALDRYQACPAAARGAVIAAVVHDDIRGRTHVSSTAELAAFESRTGKELWRTLLARISPLKLTQSRYPRKLRIFSTTPLVNEGVVYHVTNAGVIAAVDERSGDIRWLMRYPQLKDVLDNLSTPGQVWRNEPPLLRGDRLYVTPVDSPFLLCLDKRTGRVLWTARQDCGSNWSDNKSPGKFPAVWRMAGFTADGLLLLCGSDLVFLEPENGKLAWRTRLTRGDYLANDNWENTVPRLAPGAKAPKGLLPGINGEGDDFWWSLGRVYAQPTLTRDGKVCFSMQEWRGDPFPYQGPFNSDYVLDLKKREFGAQRRWYHPPAFIFDDSRNVTVAKRVINEESESFAPAARMSFVRWGIPFEVDTTYRHIVVRYDRGKMQTVLAKSQDLESQFAKAEIARKVGAVKEAIARYEECKTLLPSEEEDRRRNLNLRLFPLYTELARWGHQAHDLELLEYACRHMGGTASNPTQEVMALLAYAELYEKRGAWAAAVRVLQNASRHYWNEPLGISELELGQREEQTAAMQTGLRNLRANVPGAFNAAAQEMFQAELAGLDDYFLSVANVHRGHRVETRALVARKLAALLSRAPAAFRAQYEKDAQAEMPRASEPEWTERLLWCWPRSAAASEKLKELSAQAAGRSASEKRIWDWRLADLAQTCGLKAPGPGDGKAALAPAPRPALPNGQGFQETESKNDDPDTVRLALPQRGDRAAAAHLLFTGGRKKHAYGNRFTVSCWDLKADRKLWDSRDILLHGPSDGGEGYEIGFEQVFIHENLAIVHGRYDVVALDRRPGEGMLPDGNRKDWIWRFRVPQGFEIQAVDLRGEILVLCGPGGTLGLWVRGGEVMWEEAEAGEFYAGPYFHREMLLTVRRSPAEVSFRDLGTGRLLSRLELDGLTTNRKHPLFAAEEGGLNPAAMEAAEAVPVACAEGLLAVTDGQSYQVVDLERRAIRWTRRADKLDPSVDPAFRFWIAGGKLIVLKRYYAVLENVVLDLASGEILWRRREGGKKDVDEKVAKFEKEMAEGDAGEAAPGKVATGLVLTSMVFVDGIACGIRYEMNASVVRLVGMDLASGNEVFKAEGEGFTDPEAHVEESASQNCVVVRIQDGNQFELWQVDVKAKKIVQRLKIGGYGRLGEYGDVSAVWQGPHLCLWAFANRKFTRP